MRRFNGCRSLPVLGLVNSMIDLLIDDGVFLPHGIADGFGDTEADTTAPAGFNKAVLRTCIKCITSVHEFRMQYDVALLWRRGFQIGQPFPGPEIFCAGNTALRH